MLKKLRRRFVLSVMISVIAVLLLFAVSLCLWNQLTTTADLDRMLDGIAAAEQKESPPVAPNGFPMTGVFEIGRNEREYATRFFSVHVNKSGNVRNMDFISAVSKEEADAYAARVIAGGRQRGWLDIYRYLVVKTENDEKIVIFLNASVQQQMNASLIMGAVVVIFLASLMIFVLVLIFSNGAIRPYIKNMEQQKRFITDASHELKTPLTSIATSAEILAMEQSEENEWIANIRTQISRMTRLVNNLVALSRLNEEVPFPEMTDFSLTETAWEIAEPFAAVAGEKGKTLNCVIADKLMMRGDQNAIQQLISILLDNAVKYALPNSEILLTVESLHGKNRICVQNRCSFPAGFDHSRLFDRFYRPDISRSAETGGTGIGLAMAKAIAESHHGSIQAKVTDNKEIQFTVVL